jgi:hypothetical protein
MLFSFAGAHRNASESSLESHSGLNVFPAIAIAAAKAMAPVKGRCIFAWFLAGKAHQFGRHSIKTSIFIGFVYMPGCDQPRGIAVGHAQGFAERRHVRTIECNS